MKIDDCNLYWKLNIRLLEDVEPFGDIAECLLEYNQHDNYPTKKRKRKQEKKKEIKKRNESCCRQI